MIKIQLLYLPPFWIVAEMNMFGELLTIYKNLDKVNLTVTGNKLDDLSNWFSWIYKN